MTATIRVRDETPLVSTMFDALSSSPRQAPFTLVTLGVGVVASRASRPAVECVDLNLREGAGI